MLWVKLRGGGAVATGGDAPPAPAMGLAPGLPAQSTLLPVLGGSVLFLFTSSPRVESLLAHSLLQPLDSGQFPATLAHQSYGPALLLSKTHTSHHPVLVHRNQRGIGGRRPGVLTARCHRPP